MTEASTSQSTPAGGSVRRLVQCSVCGGSGKMEFPVHGTCPKTGFNTIGKASSVCFLCMGHGEVHPLKIQMLENGEIKKPTSGYYLPKVRCGILGCGRDHLAADSRTYRLGDDDKKGLPCCPSCWKAMGLPMECRDKADLPLNEPTEARP